MTLDLISLSIRPQGAAPLFAPVSLCVAAGEVATVMGPSGIGKSTLLDAIGGHLSPAFTLLGDVRLNGASVIGLPAEARRIGLMFQEALLFPHLSVGDNLAFGLAAEVKGKAARRAAVEQALLRAGLAGFYALMRRGCAAAPPFSRSWQAVTVRGFQNGPDSLDNASMVAAGWAASREFKIEAVRLVTALSGW